MSAAGRLDGVICLNAWFSSAWTVNKELSPSTCHSPSEMPQSKDLRPDQSPDHSISSSPARPLSIDDDLQTVAAYLLSYQDPLDTADMAVNALLHPSSGVPTPPSKSSNREEPPASPGNEPSPSRHSPSQAKKLDDEGFEDMIYALSLADENPSVVPPTKETTIRSSSASPNPASPNPASPNPASPNPASLQHEFLSKPPPAPASPQPESAPISPEPHSTKTSFPSSFAAGKKSAARLAAVQASQASGKAAGFRPGKPGRSASAAPKKPSTTWNSDSDDEEDEDNRNEEDEEDEEDAEEAEEEDERLKKYRLPTAIPRSVSERGLQPNQARQNLNQLQASREGTYSMYSTSGNPQDGRPMSQAVNQGTEVGQFPNPASRREIPAVLRDQPAEPAENDPSLRPAFSQHGLLHRVMQERQEKSAKSTQEAAHRSGEPLLHVNHKPPPIQSGLLGAIASHERDRKRDGGMGAVLTLRAREQAMRQRENDELQRQSMMMMAGAPGAMGYPAAGYPNGMMNQAAMMQMMYNPQMMAAGGMMGGGATYEQLLFQQHQMQLQQQAYAQQCYMAPYGYPAVGQQGPMMPNGGVMNQGMPNGGMMSAHQSMYGFPMQQQQQQQQVAFQQALPHQSFSAPTPPFVAQNPLSPSSPSLPATYPNNPKSNSSSSNSPSVKNNPANNQFNYHP